MTEDVEPKPAPQPADEANTIEKQQNKRPVDLSSERIGLDNTNPAVLPIGTGGVPPQSKEN